LPSNLEFPLLLVVPVILAFIVGHFFSDLEEKKVKYTYVLTMVTLILVPSVLIFATIPTQLGSVKTFGLPFAATVLTAGAFGSSAHRLFQRFSKKGAVIMSVLFVMLVVALMAVTFFAFYLLTGVSLFSPA
jgi:hypothetical protein